MAERFSGEAPPPKADFALLNKTRQTRKSSLYSRFFAGEEGHCYTGASMLFTVVSFLLVLSALVLAHEAGHFFVARKAGMRVEEFGMGFPPRLFSFGRGETRYSVNAIPLGGFVRIAGENGQEQGPGTFASGSYGQRAAVLLAGVAMNVLVGWVLVASVFFVGSDMVLGEQVPKGAMVSHERVEIVDVLSGLSADQAGVVVGDVWKTVNGTAVQTAVQGTELLGAQPIGSTVLLVVERDGAALERSVNIVALPSGGSGIGVRVGDKAFVRFSVGTAFWEAGVFTASTLWAIGHGFVGWVGGLITGAGVGDVSGPVGIAKLTGQVAAEGWSPLFFFAAMLSLNLAVLNVLPFPALDGGRLLVLAVEWVRRCPLPRAWEQGFHTAGFVLLLLLVGLVTVKDILG
jgi:regulator of sigma E protease